MPGVRAKLQKTKLLKTSLGLSHHHQELQRPSAVTSYIGIGVHGKSLNVGEASGPCEMIIMSHLSMSFASERQQRVHLQLVDSVHASLLAMFSIIGTQRPLTHSVYITITSTISLVRLELTYSPPVTPTPTLQHFRNIVHLQSLTGTAWSRCVYRV